ncbi:MAG: ABC transporter ATP-binding protein [Leptolyngbya sp. SIO1E4]|nr:ABC transporter ATP-binding protein [Leptolyngbya sp. SIO1E4]
MSDATAISLKNVSKVFKRYHRPVDRLKEILLPGKPRAEEFWALQNINLEIPKGETVGIIGRNGSGKSTLLQIIAGTLQPTTGEVRVHGRVSALLELGSGFNPEFTGRQNVFFNGRILGLSQAEIEERFDRIAAFADIGEFIDQPVKTYSSGMFVRLAFSVAINAEPDILVVDEALSVGDEAFQRKCFARIYDVQEKGASVLFVSHSAASIVELCDEAALIDQGEMILRGMPKVVVANYQKLIYAPEDKRAVLKEEFKRGKLTQAKLDKESPADTDDKAKLESETSDPVTRDPLVFYDPYLIPQHSVRYQSRGAKIKNPIIQTLEDKQVNLLTRNEKYVYRYSVYFADEAFRVRFGMLIKTITGFELGGAGSHATGKEIDHVQAGTLVNVEFEFLCTLLPGTYFLNAGVLGRVDEADIYLDRSIDALMFKVNTETDLTATGIIDFQIVPKVSNCVVVTRS